jgi:hypothetical protein
VSDSSLSFDLSQARLTKFHFNCQQISAAREQLAILVVVSAFVLHPIIHSYLDKLYQHRDIHGIEPYDDIFLHGQSLNESAEFPAFLFPVSGRWMRSSVLIPNALRSLPKHKSKIERLFPYSPTFKFLCESRLVHKLVRKYHLPVNPEHFFITSVLHSIDHSQCAHCTRRLNLDSTVISGMHNWFRFMFMLPSQELFTNLLKDKRSKTPFYAELYAELSLLNAHLTDQITLSISY